jgi:succinate--hydroxymethylglutarate CoA-transferase
MFIMCNKEKFWTVLANLIGKPEWATNEQYGSFKARLANRDQLTEDLDAVLMQATTAQWLERFGGQVPAAPVNDVGQALDNPFAHEQGLILDVDHPVRGSIKTLACPIRCPGETRLNQPAPRLGAHNQSILGALQPTEASTQKKAGVI